MEKKIQEEMVHSLPGLEHAVILKYGYAIEYDAIKTEEFDETFRIKKWKGLYIAGQICGTSGYEEAAGLGLMAGINASRAIEGKDPIILRRDQAYIGVMIDDLVTKGTEEPYRLLSSRAEYRLLLRHDNADERLTSLGHDIGLISDERYESFTKKQEKISKTLSLIDTINVHDNVDLNEYLTELDMNIPKNGTPIAEIIKRPYVKLEEIIDFFPELVTLDLTEDEIEEVEIQLKFEGYIKKQEKEATNSRKLENLSIPENIDYLHMDGLALEARSKLDKIRPSNIGQASRISGVNPSDISILIMTIKKRKIKKLWKAKKLLKLMNQMDLAVLLSKQISLVYLSN